MFFDEEAVQEVEEVDVVFGIYVVAYLDIMGFKNLIMDAEKGDDEGALARKDLGALIQVINQHIGKDNLSIASQVPTDMHPKYFFASDSLLLIAPRDVNGYHGLVVLTIKAIQICHKLMELGFLVRGALACGNLFLHKGNVFGSALIEAAKGELAATHPRVILTESALQSYGSESHRGYPIKSYPLWIEDGKEIVIDTLRPEYVPAIHKYGGLEAAFATYRKHAIDNLKALDPCGSPYAKWLWAARFYNAVLSRNNDINVQAVALPRGVWRRVCCATGGMIHRAAKIWKLSKRN
jgi:hypothetical protein